jgi:hypothetical protein
MPGRFYLSTRMDRLHEGKALSDALVEHGWSCTFNWTALGRFASDQFPNVAQAEVEGIREADVLIALLPGGFGTHVEIGVALALGKTIILHAQTQEVLETPYPCVFHYHPAIRILISKALDVNAFLSQL